MSVGTDPRYQRLADAVLAAWSVPAAGRVDTKRAVLAQWTCEQSGSWPPTLNNPGFVTIGALASVGGVGSTGAVCGRQYPRFCLARFPTPGQGAQAYALLIARGHRYSSALAEARAGNGLGFLREVTNAGYGTRYTCCKGAYGRLGGKVPPVTGGTNADLAGAHQLDLTGMPAWLNDRSHVITAGDVADLRAALVAKNPGNASLGFYLDHLLPNYIGATVGKLLDEAYGLFKPGGVSGQDLAPPGSIDLPAFAAQLGDLFGGIARNALLLGFALVALLLGLWVLATSDGRAEATS